MKTNFKLIKNLFIAGNLLGVILTFVPSFRAIEKPIFGMGENKEHILSMYDMIKLAGEHHQTGWQLYGVTLFAIQLSLLILALLYPKRWIFILGASITAFLLIWEFFTPKDESLQQLLVPMILNYLSAILILPGFIAKPTPN